MEKKSIPMKVSLTVFCLGMCFSVMYSLPYIKAVFYDGMIQLTGTTNAQLGALMTIYGLGEVLTPGIGGILARKYDYKKIIGVSCLASIIGCLLLAWFPSFLMTILVWFLLVFSTLFMVWGTWFKAMRIMAPDEAQGRMTGLFYGCCGVGYFLVNSLCLYAYDKAAATSAVKGMQNVFYAFAGTLAVFTILSVVMMKAVGVRNQAAVEEDLKSKGEKVSLLADMKAVAKYRSVWYFGITLFCMYSTTISIQYFTPYFTDVMGVAVVFSGFMAVVRQYGMKIIGSPLGGVIADRVGSISKTIIASFAASAAAIAVVLFLPDNMRSIGFLTALLLFASLAGNIAGGIQYAIPTEAKVPIEYYASAIGFGSAIGFAPDLFQHVLHGYWLDKYGNAGYDYIMIYGIATSVVGMLALLKFLSEKKAEQAAAGTAEN